MKHCLRLPSQWEYLTKPLLDISFKIEFLVMSANRVYINPEKQERSELIKAYKERDELLQDALRCFDPFDTSFSRLMDYIDITGNEKRRLRNIFLSIIDQERKRNPEVKEIKIKVISRQDEFEYRSLVGEKKFKLRMTPKQKNNWLKSESSAIEEIQKRILSDKEAIKGLNAFS